MKGESMNDKKLKKAIAGVLQYGVLWGHPKYIEREHWDTLYEFYKELNNGKDFVSNKSKKAKANII